MALKEKQNLKIYTELIDYRQAYKTDKVEIIDGLFFSQYNVLRMCEFYSNSTYLGNPVVGVGGALAYSKVGKNKDAMGRDKPFNNIVNYRVLLAKTATDIDIKDMQVQADDPAHWVKAMFLNREAYKWMKDQNFSQTLNQMGGRRPKYGGYLLKKTMIDGELHIDVLQWKNVTTDQIDILNNPIIETHYLSPVDLKKKNDVWENVDAVLKANKKVNKGKTPKITVHEILGEFPISLYKEAEAELGEETSKITEDDEYTYTLQKYFIAEIGQKRYPLYCENKGTNEHVDDTYEYLSWEEMDGRGLGKGVIEDCEESQVWTNDATINEKNAMDIAGKVVLKTTSKKLANNILEVDNGKIFELGPNDTFDKLELSPAAIGEFGNQIARWKEQADNASNSYDATTGKQPPADTPYSQTALLNQVGMKPFDLKREDWGIHLTKVFYKWVIPYLIKKLKKGHTLASDFTDEELEIIDRDFATYHMNDVVKDVAMKHGRVPTQGDFENGVQTIMKSRKGKRRYLVFPDNYFDDVKAGITVISTGEQRNKTATLQSLSNLLGDVMKSFNPQTGEFMVLKNPVMARIFGTIISLSGSGIDPANLGISMGTLNAKEGAAAPSQVSAPAQQTPNAPANPSPVMARPSAPIA